MLFPLLCLLAAASVVVAKFPPNCCGLTSFFRLSGNDNSLMYPNVEEPASSAPEDACPVLNGIAGQPVCLDTSGGLFPANSGLRDVNAQCPYLSPANYSIIRDQFECVGYASLFFPTFSCTGPFSPLCKYPRMANPVSDISASQVCTPDSSVALNCGQNFPTSTSACPPFTTFNGKTYPLSDALCFTGNGSFLISPYASLLSQFSCGAGLTRRIVNQQAGCFVTIPGAIVCDLLGTPTPADCYYAVPKPDSY